MTRAAPLFKIGLIGLDTSHVATFAELLHNESHLHHVAGLRIVAAFPGGSPDFRLSMSRVPRFTEELRTKYGVAIVDSIEALPDDLDAVFLESVDGRQHLGQFRRIVGRRLPVFIDKPLAVCSTDAAAIAQLAREYQTPVMTCSALRFAEALEQALGEAANDPILGGEFYGPMPFVPELPGYFWYGIHTVEMLYRAFGTGCRRVLTVAGDRFDALTAEWADGRIAMLRGNRVGNKEYGGTIHRMNTCRSFLVSAGEVPFYASLLRAIAQFIATKHSPIAMGESQELIRFLEAANSSRDRGGWVALA